MANYAFTTYKVTGQRDQVKAFATELQNMLDKTADNFLDLYDVTKRFGLTEKCDDLHGDVCNYCCPIKMSGSQF